MDKAQDKKEKTERLLSQMTTQVQHLGTAQCGWYKQFMDWLHKVSIMSKFWFYKNVDLSNN